MKYDYLPLILKCVVVILAVLLLYWGIQLLLGGSPTLEQYLAAFTAALIALVVQLYYRTGKLTGFVEETFPRFERIVETSFSKMRQDIISIKSDVASINRKLKI